MRKVLAGIIGCVVMAAMLAGCGGGGGGDSSSDKKDEQFSALFEKSPTLTTLVSLNPFAILFTAYRSVIYGTDVPQGPPMAPNWAALGLLLGGSIVLLALTTLVFKRLEPSFAKVL